MLKYFVAIPLLLCFFLSHGGTIQIRYKVPQATQVTLNWGVNGWQIYPDKPKGTVIKNKIMRTPMIKDGDDFVVNISLPDSSVIDYYFSFTKPAGVFNVGFDYMDINELQGNKFYHSTINSEAIARLKPDFKVLKLTLNIPLIRYSGLFLAVFSMVALLLFAFKKFILKKSKLPFQPARLFFAMAIMLLCILVIIRAIITGLAIQILISPYHALPLIFKTSYNDFLYVCMLTIVFGFLFFIKRKWRITTLYIFGGVAILSILIGMLNIKITELLGRPFSYQWLYYSDFLKSTDASEAVKANIDKRSVAAYLCMILAGLPLTWIIYQGLNGRKNKFVFIVLAACICIGIFSKNSSSVNSEKTENPVTYFLSSLVHTNGFSLLGNKNTGSQKEFLVKNKNVIDPAYAAKFSQSKIKNVIVIVLESTPAEYITNYNPKYQTTPFLDSLQSSSVLFDAFYAHSPSTNKSMVSILCGVYPYLSFKTITEDVPDISWPSITSELEKAGYKTSFFNSGDNSYHGAQNFLKARRFDEIQDFRQNTCTTNFNSDTLLNVNKGMNDLCLPEKFFNWIRNDTTPFFSMMWTSQTHYPYYPMGSNINFNTNNESLERYLNGLHNSDNAIKKLVEGLKERNLFNSTLIVVLGDHGEAFGRHGQTAHAGEIFEENIHIPLILINPLLFNGERLNIPGGVSDVAPTIFSILDRPIPHEWQGENLFSLNRRRKVFFFNPYSDYLFGCRDGNYKFIYNATKNTSTLYNLKTDPYESINIADQHLQYVKELNKQVNGWIQYQDNYVNSYIK